MNRSTVDRGSCQRRTFPRRGAAPTLLVAGLLAVTGAASGMTGGSVDARFRGTWVPASAGCGSALQLVIGADKVSFVNGPQRADYTRLEQCFTCAAGGMTTARQPVWLTTDRMGDSPWQITLDDTRKGRVAVTVDFSNDRRLGARFPLGTATLKKCP